MCLGSETNLTRSWILRDVGANFNIYDDEEVPANLEAVPTELEEATILPYDEDEDEEEKERKEGEQDAQLNDDFHPHRLFPREEVMDEYEEEMNGLRHRNVPEETQ